MRIIVVLLVLAACGDDRKAAPGDAGSDAAGAIDAAVQPLAPCLDHPGDLPRPPAGQLPCELLPPGFTGERSP